MIVTFWGVRGSTPVPGPETLRYGGNTSCVSIEIGERVLVIDAGTGIRRLGTALLEDPREILLIVSHLHGDHIFGFPFFAPLYEPHSTLHLIDYDHNGIAYSLLELFDNVHVPMKITQLSEGCERVRGDGIAFLAQKGFDTATLALNHPGGALGYRITHGGRVFVHLSDNELAQAEPRPTSFEEFVAFCHGADVLSHDAQWIDADLPARDGWGHSTVRQACELAIAAGVRRLVLFHHDPDRDDDALDALQADARRILEPHGIECIAAFEGLRIELATRPVIELAEGHRA
jgi:phosphoribosyl 1,2-cyclic phosphodiesterase